MAFLKVGGVDIFMTTPVVRVFIGCADCHASPFHAMCFMGAFSMLGLPAVFVSLLSEVVDLLLVTFSIKAMSMLPGVDGVDLDQTFGEIDISIFIDTNFGAIGRLASKLFSMAFSIFKMHIHPLHHLLHHMFHLRGGPIGHAMATHLYMKDIIKHGERSNLGLSATEFLDVDSMLIPVMDGFAMVWASSMFEVDTMLLKL